LLEFIPNELSHQANEKIEQIQWKRKG